MEIFWEKELAVILGFGCLGIATIVIFAFLFQRFLRRRKWISDAATPLLQTESVDYFVEITPTLRPWDGDAISDLAANTLPVWKQKLGRYHERGTIKSLTDPRGPQWIAYEMDIRGGSGTVEMRTSHKTLRFEVKIGFRPSLANIVVDGHDLGSMQRKGKKVLLTETSGYDVGTLYRDKPPRVNERDGIEIQRSYALVDLIGRPKFQLCTYFISEDMIRGDMESIRPAFIGINWSPRGSEAEWLLALVGWEVMNSVGNRYDRYRY